MQRRGDTLYKTATERTEPAGGFFSLRDEYEALAMMYDAGVNVPEPGRYDEERKEYGMEYIDGPVLQDASEVYGQIASSMAERIADALRDGMEAMHDAGLPHGDICTSNIVLDSEAQPYYIDPAGFGPGHPDAEQVMERDRQNLDYVLQLLRR